MTSKTQYTIKDDTGSPLWVTHDADIAEAHSRDGREVTAITRGVR